MNYRIVWLRRQFKWMGQHSGYDLLCDEIARLETNHNYYSVWGESNKHKPKVIRSLLHRLGATAKSSPFYNLDSTAAEVGALWKNFTHHPHLVHITYVENQLGILPSWKKRLSLKIVGTAHQPAGWWRLAHLYPESISALDALIVPASREVSYFEKYLPGRVYFIPHGIDTEFFRPNDKLRESSANSPSLRCVFSGQYLRDLDTLAKVIDRVIAQDPRIQFDLILPRKRRDFKNPSIIQIARHEQVCWHADLNDQQLLSIYQQANILVLPILDCTSNNSLLEAIACGLPVVANDVGGLRDYTKDTFADLFPVGDDEGMTDAILRLAKNPQEREKRSQAARSFAESNFSWTKIANQTLELYDKVLAH